ncbi:hypothetical protein [Aequorivita lipolytica]|uniref:STAS/SEC14 domain-containing protein n=1 Tax=Aequorivita lipolytica TaxID=153267 RepID=A0A5C6YQF1_9FLAO|nr:hypothetical protein [Aequorivita lipolytica]TXD69175.1 hypothetical protein ESV24_09035 [Aequorivita lipolytica]SRX51242.1 hypothetical protein AEQU2_01722 [Aequorivita lipolytica]
MEPNNIKLSFGTARIYGNIVEIIIDEGTVFHQGSLKELFNLFDTHFPDENFGYISNRLNDYSIDLSPALYQSFHKNLTAVAALCYSEISYKNAMFEKAFYKHKPFDAFKDYDQAIKWIKTYL